MIAYSSQKSLCTSGNTITASTVNKVKGFKKRIYKNRIDFLLKIFLLECLQVTLFGVM